MVECDLVKVEPDTYASTTAKMQVALDNMEGFFEDLVALGETLVYVIAFSFAIFLFIQAVILWKR